MARAEQIIIVGNGIAGNAAMESIRRRSPSARVFMLSDEPFPIYSACILADYVSGELKREETFLKTMGNYRGVETRLGKSVTDVDLKNRSLSTGREKIHFDKLILATGGEAIMPPLEGMEEPGVFALKTLGDADHLAQYRAHEAVVVGSGPTGIETAVALRKRGMAVSLVELLDSLLPTVLDREVGVRTAKILEKNGIRVITGEKVTKVASGGSGIEGIETSRRKIRCQMVVWAVGVKPRTDLARNAGITTGPLGGIQVNERMETSAPGVYACGDCAEFVEPVEKRSFLQLFWPNARQMGRVAGDRCTGMEAVYAPIQPGTVLHVFSHTVASVGATTRASGKGVKVIEREAGPVYSRVIMKDGAVTGAQFMGKVEAAGPIAALIRNGCPLERVTAGANAHPMAQKLAWLAEGWG